MGVRRGAACVGPGKRSDHSRTHCGKHELGIELHSLALLLLALLRHRDHIQSTSAAAMKATVAMTSAVRRSDWPLVSSP